MAAKVTPEKVIEVLNKAGVHFVVMGTHGVGSWRSEARATHDVDVLVRKKDLARAVSALKEKYPKLEVKEFPVVIRFIDPATGMGVIDVMKPVQEVFQIVFRQTLTVKGSHRIPNLEMALVSKFAAMVSPHRAEKKKLIDAGDFMDIVETNVSELDLAKLERLANKVYPDGGKEILKLVEDIKAGRRIQF